MTILGRITTLRAGEYEAVVAEVGATLVSLTHGGRHLVQPFSWDPQELAEGFQGRTLVPWPNRVVGGRYRVAGQTLQLPINEPESNSALHGLGCFVRWDEAERGTWVLDLPASYGYPFEVRCEATYRLDPGRGLEVHVSGTNVGGRPAPFGASVHPYLSCDGRPLSECSITVPASQVLLTDDRLAPTTVVPVNGELDLRRVTPLADTLIDNAFTGLPAGEWVVELTHPTAGGVRMTSAARWVQLYTGDRIGRMGAAVEPMTCEPDAFNRSPEAVMLEPGASRELLLTISAI